VAAATALLSLSGGAAAEEERDPSALREHVLVIGRVSADPNGDRAALQGMVDHFAGRMRDLGILGGRVVVAPDNATMITFLRAGKVDWVSETALSALRFEAEGNAEIVARRWKDGVVDYRTLFFARDDSGIRSLEDLEGRSIAFEDPGSTSAYFLPAAVLIETGLKLVPLSPGRQAPPPDAVGYVFSGDERNTSDWVHSGVVDVGVLSDSDWLDPQRMPSAYKKEVRVIHRTRRLPRALELVRADLGLRVKERLVDLLTHAHDDPAAVKAMAAYRDTRRFDAIDAPIREDLEALRPLGEIVREKLGP
jgi:phosphonate transport system substrate-binding protein